MKTLYILFLLLFSTITIFAQVFDGKKLDEVCMPAVVCIQISNGGSGSGFVVEKNGYIVTNYHVIEKAYSPNDITIEFNDGNKYPCIEITRKEKNIDLALLKIQKVNCSVLPISNELVARGTEIATLGCPVGQKMQYNKGEVSNTQIINKEQGIDNFRIQIDISINPGNSGGAIVNKNGQVVAVAQAKNINAVGIGYAIKSEILLGFLKRGNITTNTAPLLTDEELKVASFEASDKVKAEVEDKLIKKAQGEKQVDKAQTEAEIAAINEEKRTKAKAEEAERQRIEQRNRDEMYLDKMDNVQREEILKQQALQQKSYLAREYEMRIESLEDQNKRRQMALDKDVLAGKEANLKYRKDVAAYNASLPQRFSTRIGVGAAYYIATLGNSGSVNFDVNNIGFLADVMLGYRLDRKGNNYKSRATTIGANVKLGAWNNTIIPRLEQAQNWNTNYSNLRTEQPFVAFGLTFLLREWFKLEANYGTQYIYSAQDIYSKAYGDVTTGFIVRFGAVELEASVNTLWLQDFAKPTFRGNLMLVYHAKWAKW